MCEESYCDCTNPDSLFFAGRLKVTRVVEALQVLQFRQLVGSGLCLTRGQNVRAQGVPSRFVWELRDAVEQLRRCKRDVKPRKG